MAERAHDKKAGPNTAGMAAGPANGGPPPSTLAAQLVENISASTKSSRSDENTELKGLFAIIQRVKDDPEILKSTDERVEHNHMLIYVYCRVVLEAINLDDPFIDRAHVRAEALKAINFLRFTIKETPSVLNYQSNKHGLMFRGEEPLWLWLLPQLLRMLGHAQCQELEGSIEGFLQYLLLVLVRSGVLWELTSSLALYLRAVLTGLLDCLQDPSVAPPQNDARMSVLLPPAYALDQILGKNRSPSQRISYTVRQASQALRQAASLANIMAYPLLSQDSAFSYVASLSENGPWLLDAWLDLRNAQKRWDTAFQSSPMPVLEMTLDLIKARPGEITSASPLRQKAYTLVVLLCSEMASTPKDLIKTDPTGDGSRLTYCMALIAVAQASLQSRSIGRLAASKLVDELILLSSQYPAVAEETDVWRCTKLLQQAIEISPQQTFDESTHSSKFHDERVRKSVEGLHLTHEQADERTNRTKRQKLSNHDTDRSFQVMQQICDALQLDQPNDDDVYVFEQQFLEGFPRNGEASQCQAIDLLSRICCMADTPIEINGPTSASRSVKCPVCEGGVGARRKLSPNSGKDEVRLIFTGLIRLRPFLESRRPRIAAMIALRRLALHSNDPNFLNLEKSDLGQWCLQSLNSSVRELRIAAGRTLATFLLGDPTSHANDDMIRRNRTNSISLLKSISEKNQPHLVETCAMAWGQLGRVVAEEELNLVLIKLLEYLGSSNNLVSAFAFNELLGLAKARDTTARRLLEPFWRSLAYLATKDMVHRPQRSRAIAELLQISVNELLLLIQTHALPWLVLDKRKDVIQKIAEARGETETWMPVMDSANLAATLALLLAQETDDIEAFTKSRLNEISPHFHNLPLFNMLQSEPVLIVLELLKAAGDADASRQSLVREGLRTMATMILASNKDSKHKKGNIIGRFLSSYVLGLMARLTDVINDSDLPPSPVPEQRRCIRALEEMIKVCRAYCRVARPQISACLLAAMSQDTLRETAFSCWAAMLTYLEREDIEALLETTFFIVGHYWSSLNSATAVVAKDMLTFVLDKYPTPVANQISHLPALPRIDALSDIQARIQKARPNLLMEDVLEVFSERIGHDNSGVVLQALIELVPYLASNQTALYASAVSQRPDAVITTLLRALLDCACKYNSIQVDVARLCTECVGLIGCLDSNQIETVRKQRSIVILNNFDKEEMTDFALFLLEEVLVPSFLSATDTRLQGFLSYTMQEVLDRCDIKDACQNQSAGMLAGNDIYRKWIALPENIREVVTPFLSSRYLVAPMAPVMVEYPLFRPGRPYANWLRSFVVDLLRNGQNNFADMLFEPLTRVIRVKDLMTAEFLLPYLIVHVLLGPKSDEEARSRVLGELLGILQHQPSEDATYQEKEDMKRFCHAVFRVLDYSMRWVQAKRSQGHVLHGSAKADAARDVTRIQDALDSIPAELIAQRAIDCNEYARSLFNLEQHAQKLEHQKREPGDRNRLLERLQDIYANIDEPDGLEGISAHLHELDINQQILSHKKAGRWTAAQTWYEMQLAEKPDSVEVQIELLNCLKQAGQHDVLLNHVEGMRTDSSSDNKIMPFAVEAAWVTGRWESLAKFTNRFHGNTTQDFNISIATLFESLHKQQGPESFAKKLQDTREKISSSMNTSATASLQAAHGLLLKCHVLTDLEIIVGANTETEDDRRATMGLLDGRLEVIGAYFNDKQYLLGIRRAAMELSRPKFSDVDISGLWLSSARIARKTDSLHQSFNAVLHATQLGDDAATIQNAKLLWRDNHHRKAIQILQGAIERNKFMTQGVPSASTANNTKLNSHQKLLTARAQLLLAKWLDNAGQTHAGALREKYQQPPKTCSSWEKGHYYLGRHYKKILESEKPLKVDDQSDNYLTGEIARLVIENYVRSLNWGTKYLYQTLPRILTLWLDVGAQVDKAPEGKTSLSRELYKRRVEQLHMLHSFLDKYIHRLPAYIFYTALPQIVARIAHQNPDVFERLKLIIVKVVEAHPRQALWSVIGIMTSKQVSPERKARGLNIVAALKSVSRKVDGNQDLKYLLRAGEKLAEQLLLACQNGDFPGNKAVHASLTRDLRFNHKCTPCPLVVPVEGSLTATLPAISEFVKKHKAFSRDVVTIDNFLDDVLVLSSLAKPRRLTARGTDGKSYMLLIKPKDDLRTDQRLMEFNGMINRSLKRDAESSRRQLYIRTYAVVPLNEECGIIEWVPGIKTMRDILLGLYAAQKIHPDYAALRQLMDDASASESKIRIFTNDVLGRFPPVLHMWFVQQFPNPSAWFAARLKYTRSCAVMSMVGTILGLGDRHGENVNLEEGNGGVFHVDFNCLFDKGLTFAKPERVPFRLTHNMVAAMGIYGFEGPFRKSSELTLSILRQQEETLMTILESFIYDPTLDLQKDKRARRGDAAVKLHPQSVVDSIKRKVKGLLPNESIPLGVEGQVEELIKQAIDPRNLTAMYIGWCPFL